MVEELGVCDDDPVFMIDVGPNTDRICILKDGAGVEISDDPVLLEG